MLKLDLFLTLIKWFFCLNLTRTYGLPLSKHTVDNWTKCSAILKTCKVHCYSESDLHRENVSTKSHTFVKHSHGFLSKYFLHCFKLFFFLDCLVLLWIVKKKGRTSLKMSQLDQSASINLFETFGNVSTHIVTLYSLGILI